MTILKTFLITMAILSVLDGIWLGFLSADLYKNTIRDIQGSSISFKFIGAIVAYLLMGISITSVIHCGVIHKLTKTPKVLFIGALTGLIIYGIFNGTNFAIFKNWNAKVSVIDTLWGTTLYAVTTYLVHKFH